MRMSEQDITENAKAKEEFILPDDLIFWHKTTNTKSCSPAAISKALNDLSEPMTFTVLRLFVDDDDYSDLASSLVTIDEIPDNGWGIVLAELPLKYAPSKVVDLFMKGGHNFNKSITVVQEVIPGGFAEQIGICRDDFIAAVLDPNHQYGNVDPDKNTVVSHMNGSTPIRLMLVYPKA